MSSVVSNIVNSALNVVGAPSPYSSKQQQQQQQQQGIDQHDVATFEAPLPSSPPLSGATSAHQQSIPINIDVIENLADRRSLFVKPSSPPRWDQFSSRNIVPRKTNHSHDNSVAVPSGHSTMLNITEEGLKKFTRMFMNRARSEKKEICDIPERALEICVCKIYKEHATQMLMLVENMFREANVEAFLQQIRNKQPGQRAQICGPLGPIPYVGSPPLNPVSPSEMPPEIPKYVLGEYGEKGMGPWPDIGCSGMGFSFEILGYLTSVLVPMIVKATMTFFEKQRRDSAAAPEHDFAIADEDVEHVAGGPRPGTGRSARDREEIRKDLAYYSAFCLTAYLFCRMLMGGMETNTRSFSTAEYAKFYDDFSKATARAM